MKHLIAIHVYGVSFYTVNTVYKTWSDDSSKARNHALCERVTRVQQGLPHKTDVQITAHL